jgi:hypothetical protein
VSDIWEKFLSSGQDQDLQATKKRKKLIFNIFAFVLLLLIVGIWLLIDMLASQKQEAMKMVQEASKTNNQQIELPHTDIDQDLRWRQYLEDDMRKSLSNMEVKFQELMKQQNLGAEKKMQALLDELAVTQEKLKMSQAELASASLDFRRISSQQQESGEDRHEQVASKMITKQDLLENFEHEMDVFKPAESFIAEGTYFTGYMLGGISVSTALAAADEHATPVVIRLTDRGNLDLENPLDIKQCRILGSAYGDLASERAIIRLEKLICKIDGSIQTTEIAGQVIGPDGYNGVKGKVVATGEKHLKNAMLGGIISGFAGSAKGQDAVNIFGGGVVGTAKKGAKEMFGQGALQGASNAGEKLAEYYLRRAEALSPVLFVAGGVRVNPQITKGVFLGQRGTKKQIQAEKK